MIAIFAGPSGSGKTEAAEALAAKIDLDQALLRRVRFVIEFSG